MLQMVNASRNVVKVHSLIRIVVFVRNVILLVVVALAIQANNAWIAIILPMWSIVVFVSSSARKDSTLKVDASKLRSVKGLVAVGCVLLLIFVMSVFLTTRDSLNVFMRVHFLLL